MLTLKAPKTSVTALKPLPVVFMETEPWVKFVQYINLAKGEISGLGIVEKFGRQDLIVTELYLLPQQATLVSTELDLFGQADFMSEMLQQGKDLQTVKLWWHSHAEMLPFWSSVDDKNIETFHQNEWMLSLVGSKTNPPRARLDLFNPLRITIDGLRIVPLQGVYNADVQALKDEVALKVQHTDLIPGIPADGSEGEDENG